MVKKNIDNEEIRQKCILLFSSKFIMYKNFEYTDEYKQFFSIKSVLNLLNDAELIKTAMLFFDSSLNISASSKVGFMHRNTLIYRLDKIKKLIGLDIRIFKEAVILENILLCYNQFNSTEQI